MDFTLISCIILFCCIFYNKAQYNNAKKMLDNSQVSKVSEAISAARKIYKYPGLILTVSLIIGLITFTEFKGIIFFSFFGLCFINDMIYYINLKKLLSSSKIPDQFINVIEKSRLYHLGSMLIVVVAFGIDLIY